jgi:hypothetical protein
LALRRARSATVAFEEAMDTYLRRALEEVERAVGPLDAAAMSRGVDGRWSACDILEHLTLAFRANGSALEKALASGTLKARPPRLSQRAGKLLVIGLGYFPRVEAPEGTRPCGSIAPGGSLAAIRDALAALDATMARAVERFGVEARVVNHPFFAGLTVPEWRKFHWRHAVHHMRQVTERTRW